MAARRKRRRARKSTARKTRRKSGGKTLKASLDQAIRTIRRAKKQL